ncbi:MAG: M20/M25/M40 family metallo-hydrolase [Phycisphaeraceae bacterium]|nr:M20/M25/M40 family metallo-hydrolase [Phycisphaeraceae bacterium]
MRYDLLRTLCEAPGVAGREERIRDIIRGEIKGLFDEVEEDRLGSLICTRRAKVRSSTKGSRKSARTAAAPRVLLAAHMDEIGFYVRHVDDEGMVWLNPAGGFDPRNLFSRRVVLITRDGDFTGVMNPGGKPIHISSEAERSKVPGVEEFFVDLGLDAATVRKAVQIGDFVVPHEPFFETERKVVSKAIDNRVACFIAIETMRAIAKRGSRHGADLIVAFTTQEEVGLRGALVAAQTVGADIGVGIDVNLACDTPGVPETQRVTKQGAGAAIMVQDSSMISDHRLIEEVCAVARRHRIAHQRAILPRGGQDAGAIQRAGRGARCIAIGPGTRYIHTVTEMIDKRDTEACIELLAAWLPTVS